MADLQQMSRVLFHHDWTHVEDWARSVDRLADLTDEEIGQLQQCDGDLVGSGRPAIPASANGHPPSLVDRTLQSLLGLCDLLRYGSRRAC